MRISELSRRTGVSAHALRHYDRLGLLKPSRRPSGYRDYDEAAVRDVGFIAIGRRMGFALSTLAQALPAYRSGRLTPQQGIVALRERIEALDREIAARQALRSELLQHLERMHERVQSPPARGRAAWPGGAR